MARGMDAPAERWTLEGRPTDAFHDKPVYILISGRTFDPATGKGWEAEGIEPDIEVAYSPALERAVKEATR